MLVQLFRLLALVSCVSLVACKEYKVREIKDFRLYVQSDDQELKAAIKELADQFNKDVGGNALTVVDSEDSSNSNISFVENLKDENGSKLGLGQWRTTQTEKNKFKANGSETEVVVVHSMNIEFDMNNFVGKISKISDKSSKEYKHLYHLFCHEVGHGMQLDHDANNVHSVMNPVVSYKSQVSVDYDHFFGYVRSYMGVHSNAQIAEAL
ncbi:MAG: hypothetical protein EOP10_01940 [Proteobacteria bacterium]|nr:MAG: hypothetical protein EOP10_01940 [Pseudomonadota bacterium]